MADPNTKLFPNSGTDSENKSGDSASEDGGKNSSMSYAGSIIAWIKDNKMLAAVIMLLFVAVVVLTVLYVMEVTDDELEKTKSAHDACTSDLDKAKSSGNEYKSKYNVCDAALKKAESESKGAADAKTKCEADLKKSKSDLSAADDKCDQRVTDAKRSCPSCPAPKSSSVEPPAPKSDEKTKTSGSVVATHPSDLPPSHRA